MKVNMYLETSIRGLQKTAGIFGYVLECFDRNGEPHTVSNVQMACDVTPYQLILVAFCAALERMDRPSEITVYTDKLYLRGNFPRLDIWQANGWKKPDGEPVRNVELWQQASKLAAKHQITFAVEAKHSYKNWLASELRKPDVFENLKKR